MALQYDESVAFEAVSGAEFPHSGVRLRRDAFASHIRIFSAK